MAIQLIKASLIVIPEIKLREVNKEREEYVSLVASLKSIGFKGAITGRHIIDQASGAPGVELTDGLHRLTAFKEVYGPDAEIAIDVTHSSAIDSAVQQFVMNNSRVPTKPCEYAAHLKMVLASDPVLTIADVAKRFAITPTQVENYLGLNKIDDQSIKADIDEGRISATNGMALAKLPKEMHADFVSAARTDTAAEFAPKVRQALAEHNAAVRAGKTATVPTFTPVAKARSVAELKEAESSEAIVEGIVNTYGGAVNEDVKNGIRAALKWAVSLDPVSIKKANEKWEADRAADEARKAQKEAERLAKIEAERKA